MKLENLKGYRAKPIDEIRHFAVNLPLVRLQDMWQILFEVRALHMFSQAGEICLAGGAVEQGETYYEACVRESVEELGVDKSKIQYISELDYIIAPTFREIRPFLTIVNIDSLDELRVNPDEVDSVFTVPVDFFRNNPADDYAIKNAVLTPEDFPYALIPNGKDYKWGAGRSEVSFYVYEDKVIWGLTARIVKRAIELLDDYKVFD